MKIDAGFSGGSARTKNTAKPLTREVSAAASARYSARRKLLRAVALRASDFATTAALRKARRPAAILLADAPNVLNGPL